LEGDGLGGGAVNGSIRPASPQRRPATPARISAAATGDSAGKVRPLLPRLAWLVPVLLALGRRCSSSRWGWRLEESRGVMEGGGGGRWAPTLPRSAAASLFYWPLRGEHPLGLGGVIFFSSTP